MHKCCLDELIRTELLPYVNQPGQYIGREVNQLVHDGDWERAEVRVAIAFPDAYTIGMSHRCQVFTGSPTTRRAAGGMSFVRGSTPKRASGSQYPAVHGTLGNQLLPNIRCFLQYEMAFTCVLQLLDLSYSAASGGSRHRIRW
jgi:hypothetical protein